MKNKKRIFVFLVILSVVTAGKVFAFDLWWGLDTNASREKLMAAARDVLGVKSSLSGNGHTTLTLFREDLGNRLLTRNIEEVMMVSSDRRLNQKPSSLGMVLPNLSYFFANGKLVAVSFKFAYSEDQQLQVYRKEFGEPKVMMSSFDKHPIYVWETPEKELFLLYSTLTVISKQILRQ